MDFSRVKVTHQSANTSTALSYLMKMGWTGSREMTAMAKEIRGFTLSQKIIVTTEYLPGKLNMRADWASRNFPDSSKWLLSPKVFQIISRNWGTVEIDLFASRACHQLHTYMAWRPDPHSQALDALQQKWKNLGRLYAHPPPPFLTDRKSSLKSHGRGINKDFGNYKLPCTTLVQSNLRSVHNRASTPATISGTFGKSQGTNTPSSFEQGFKTNGMENFRKNLVEKGISNTAANLISISRRSGTTATII